MISVMAGVVAGAGLVGTIYSGVRCSNGFFETKYDQKQLLGDETVWSSGRKRKNESNGYSLTKPFKRNKKDETFTQLLIWKY